VPQSAENRDFRAEAQLDNSISSTALDAEKICDLGRERKYTAFASGIPSAGV